MAQEPHYQRGWNREPLVAARPTVSTKSPKTKKVPLRNTQCGQDRLIQNTGNDTVLLGKNNIENFPWLGLLIYPFETPRPTTTAVVLISKEIALSAALDIDYYPKKNFRAQSRVVLGNNCTGPFIRVRDYTFGPDFTRTTYSSLVVLHLDTSHYQHKIFPICRPPQESITGEEVFAMTLFNDCYNSSMVMVHKMEYMFTENCRDFYRKMELDIETMWPTHLVCAQGDSGGHCIWRSATALVIRHEGLWKLLGLSIYGPGCESPSRFLDYGMYDHWVQRTIARIGQPSITRIAKNHLILRRTMTSIPRFGHCDSEERKPEIFSDRITVMPPYTESGEYEEIANLYYNVTLQQDVNYHCIILRTWHVFVNNSAPVITIHRYDPNAEQKMATPNKNIYYFVEVRLQGRYLSKI
uniref:Peptidase S1 domain-containing protein n=1 Tax=Heliothis virescens TaxID=7102 RepID=A0A2A4K0V7_HELVI